MSLASVTAFFATHAPDIAIERYATSTATVALAAQALGVAPGQIAKTLSLRLDDEVVLLVARGDARLDNRKYKERFGQKAKLLNLDEVEIETGHRSAAYARSAWRGRCACSAMCRCARSARCFPPPARPMRPYASRPSVLLC